MRPWKAFLTVSALLGLVRCGAQIPGFTGPDLPTEKVNREALIKIPGVDSVDIKMGTGSECFVEYSAAATRIVVDIEEARAGQASNGLYASLTLPPSHAPLSGALNFQFGSYDSSFLELTLSRLTETYVYTSQSTNNPGSWCELSASLDSLHLNGTLSCDNMSLRHEGANASITISPSTHFDCDLSVRGSPQ